MRAAPGMKWLPVVPPKLSSATEPSWHDMHRRLVRSRSATADPEAPLCRVYVAVVRAWFHRRPAAGFAKCGVWQGLQISPPDQAYDEKSWAELVIWALAPVVRPARRAALSQAFRRFIGHPFVFHSG